MKIDYNNDGKDEILTGARYDSGSGAGCSHTLFRIYVSPDAPTRLITNGEPNGIYFHGGNTKDGYEIFTYSPAKLDRPPYKVESANG